MSRDLTNEMIAEVTADSLSPIYIFKAEFDSGDSNFWTGRGSLVFNGDTYTGLGDFLSISEVVETQNAEANGLSVTLSGIPSSLISVALSEKYQGRTVTIWFGCLDSTGALISSPIIVFRGFMDVMELLEGGNTAALTVKAENELIILNRAKERRYTDEDQKLDYPSDVGFEFVTALQDAEITWGKS